VNYFSLGTRLNLGSAVRQKPVLIYDSDCKFCCQWISRWQHVTGRGVEHAPFQKVGKQFPAISEERFNRSVQFAEPDGVITEGAEAVLRALAYNPRIRLPLWAYENLPGAAPVCEWAYRQIAKRRHGRWTLTRLF